MICDEQLMTVFGQYALHQLYTRLLNSVWAYCFNVKIMFRRQSLHNLLFMFYHQLLPVITRMQTVLSLLISCLLHLLNISLASSDDDDDDERI